MALTTVRTGHKLQFQTQLRDRRERHVNHLLLLTPPKLNGRHTSSYIGITVRVSVMTVIYHSDGSKTTINYYLPVVREVIYYLKPSC